VAAKKRARSRGDDEEGRSRGAEGARQPRLFHVQDESLLKMAVRIQARAIKRCGDLPKTYDGPGRNNHHGEVFAQKQAAKKAGLSKRQFGRERRFASGGFLGAPLHPSLVQRATLSGWRTVPRQPHGRREMTQVVLRFASEP
jgi:hypothetical protein